MQRYSSETSLVQACIQKDRKAQNQLYEQYKVKLFGLCLRYARSKEEAEDFLLEGFQKIFKDLHQFKYQSALETWMRRVMINTALMHLRKKKSIHFESIDDGLIEQVPAIEPAIIGKMNAATILNCIQQLPIGYQTIFNLVAIEGYPHKEIAAKLGITESTSRSQFARARKALQGLVKKVEEEESKDIIIPNAIKE